MQETDLETMIENKELVLFIEIQENSLTWEHMQSLDTKQSIKLSKEETGTLRMPSQASL